MELAEKADSEEIPDGMDIPEELSRRQKRLEAITAAKGKIEQRATKRYAQEQKEYEAKVAAREESSKKSGKKPRGKGPKPPESGPLMKDQVNLTDEESRIMPSSKGFEQAYNPQIAVGADDMMIVECHVSQDTNDKKELEPVLSNLGKFPEELQGIDTLLADAGYYSEENVAACEQAGIEPFIPPNRDKHNIRLSERFSNPESFPDDGNRREKMKHKLKTDEGRRTYSKRESTVEPVFGIIKHVMGFRQFLLRGLDAVLGEWTLVSISWNLKRMFALNG